MNLISYFIGLISIAILGGLALRGVRDKDRVWSYWVGFSQSLLILLLTELIL